MMKLVVLSCLLAAASAGLITPLTYSAPYGYYGFGAPFAYSASLLAPHNYRGPLSLAPGQPANILGADGRPLDTLEVNLDRSAHLTAKALDSGIHLLKKRSVAGLITPLTYSSPYGYYGLGAPLTYSASLLAPSNYRGPLSLAPGQPANILGADGRPLDTLDVNLDRAAHLTAKALNSGIHLLKKRSVVAPIVATPVTHIATPLITPAVPLTYRSPYATTAYISPIPHASLTTQTTFKMIKLVVLSCLLAAASAGIIAPLAYTAPLVYSATVLAPSNYRGPLSLAPGQPANILAADGRPLDTLEVNLDRSAHYTAKALNNGFHLLKKRSVVAPVVAAPIARLASPLITHTVPLTYAAPVFSTAHLAPLAYTHTAVTRVL
ncbi:unnamed protein product [Parnassius mnemosyne]|uniref:Cuticle protein n=1 Tax=Parnassius mnemosyne TaxID=213953 RepID=A0AAV1KTC4_9NEOP